MGCQIFLQQRWVYSGWVENCSSESTTMVSHGQVPTQQRKENVFTEWQKKKTTWEGYSKQRVQGFSLAEYLTGNKRGLSSSCWFLLLWQGIGPPPLVFQIYLIEVSVYWFYISSSWSRSFSETTSDQESGFLVSVSFWPSMPGRNFVGCNVPCWRENAQIGNLLRSHSSNKDG